MSTARASFILASVLALSAPAFAEGRYVPTSSPAYKQARREFRATMRANPRLELAHAGRSIGNWAKGMAASTAAFAPGPMILGAMLAGPAGAAIGAAGTTAVIAPLVTPTALMGDSLAPVRYRTVQDGVKKGLIPASKMKRWDSMGLFGQRVDCC